MIREEAGLAGVAALIIFAALIMVAAISAAVIIDVTGGLEQQVEQTGQDATGQLSSSLQILSVIGQVDEDEPQINEVRYVVSISPGTTSVDLNRLSIDYVTSQGSTTLQEGDGTDDTFQVQQLVGDDDNNIISSSDQRYRIDIDHTGGNLSDGIGELQENDRVEARFTTGPGGQKFDEFIVPSTLSGQSGAITL